jgi:hypothetical protein
MVSAVSSIGTHEADRVLGHRPVWLAWGDICNQVLDCFALSTVLAPLNSVVSIISQRYMISK